MRTRLVWIPEGPGVEDVSENIIAKRLWISATVRQKATEKL